MKISLSLDKPISPGSGNKAKQQLKNNNANAVQGYISASLADNTLRAYRADLKHFLAWGGTIPATEQMIAEYVAEHATSLSNATLKRRVVAINRAHVNQGLPSPTGTELVKATLQGIRRKLGKRQHQVAALQKNELIQLVKGMKGLRGIRDIAMLLIGFAAALRRSELVALNVEDVDFVTDGALIQIRRSKTDQEGKGRTIAVPFVHGPYCPARSLQAWLKVSGIKAGPIFRRIGRFGDIQQDRLTDQSVALIIKKRAEAAGLNPGLYSGHSLRAGFATTAAEAGVNPASIRIQTGHQPDTTLQRYIRPSQLFADNPNRKVW